MKIESIKYYAIYFFLSVVHPTNVFSQLACLLTSRFFIFMVSLLTVSSVVFSLSFVSLGRPTSS